MIDGLEPFEERAGKTPSFGLAKPQVAA